MLFKKYNIQRKKKEKDDRNGSNAKTLPTSHILKYRTEQCFFFMYDIKYFHKLSKKTTPRGYEQGRHNKKHSLKIYLEVT